MGEGGGTAAWGMLKGFTLVPGPSFAGVVLSSLAYTVNNKISTFTHLSRDPHEGVLTNKGGEVDTDISRQMANMCQQNAVNRLFQYEACQSTVGRTRAGCACPSSLCSAYMQTGCTTHTKSHVVKRDVHKCLLVQFRLAAARTVTWTSDRVTP